eukprot:1181407-Prorocentrum_minimum.AAC.1
MLWLHCLPERLDSCQFCEQSTCGGCEHVPISATRLSALVSTISETPLSAMSSVTRTMEQSMNEAVGAAEAAKE